MPCPIEYLSNFPYFQYGHASFPQQTQQQWNLLRGWGCGKAALWWTSMGVVSCQIREDAGYPGQNWPNLTWKGTVSKTLLQKSHQKSLLEKQGFPKLLLSNWLELTLTFTYLTLRIHGQGFPYIHMSQECTWRYSGGRDIRPPTWKLGNPLTTRCVETGIFTHLYHKNNHSCREKPFFPCIRKNGVFKYKQVPRP